MTYIQYNKVQFKRLIDILWDKVIRGFIIKSPRLKDSIIKKEYNIILKVVNRLTKYSYIISFQEKYIIK